MNRIQSGSSPLAFVFMAIGAIAFTIYLLLGITIINTGNVGIYKSLGEVDLEEREPGLRWAPPIYATIDEYNAKEMQIDLNDLTPKTDDNLSLRDLDVSVYVKPNPTSIAELIVKYQMGADQMLYRAARDAAYSAAANQVSLDIHRHRDVLREAIQHRLQAVLDSSDEGAFEVTKVIVRSILTDPSIEQSIQKAVSEQKRLQAKQIEVDIAKKDAEIEIERAKGIARSNEIINKTLTPEYLQHEANQVNMKFAENAGKNGMHTIMMNGSNAQVMPTLPINRR